MQKSSHHPGALNGLPDALTTVIQVLADDDDLWLWYESLAEFPVSQRAAELRRTAARINESGASEGLRDIAHAIALLSAPGMYESTLDASRELRASR